ncbi:unnamed protein product [Fusarium graminearum]|uniref:Chromosome 1, complete genome n=2 Tax=Gibberella zeae TaxID=5518 RepID=A0A098D9T0_GIBZE|nr:unnamed protein product [Fusarium graminearum]CAF3569046.1 unnamed protein product [Fusarium graminearum]CAF3646962.1 unnamed protein product [Fusarium graminearum]CAG1967688.1 unnamed protein product [Fusarium graminearum]CAG1970066.1 unnamed protein product [Fusarium graminearum]
MLPFTIQFVQIIDPVKQARSASAPCSEHIQFDDARPLLCLIVEHVKKNIPASASIEADPTDSPDLGHP